MQILYEQNRARSLRIPRSFWCSVAFATLFLILFGIWIARASSWALFPQQAKLGLVLASFASFALSYTGSTRASPSTDAQAGLPSRRIIWSLVSFRLVLLAQAIGNLLYTYNFWHQLFVFPSWADAILLLVGYPALFVGILRLPVRSSSGKSRTRAVLDSLLLVTALITLSWYFTLGPTLLSVAGGSLLPLVAALAYPAFDLLLIICALLFTAWYCVGAARSAIALLILVLVVSAITDGYASFCLLQQQVYLSAWPNLGWALSSFVLALTIQAMRWPSARQMADETDPSTSASFATLPLWRALLPYSLVVAVIGLVIYVWGMHQQGLLTRGTYVCGVALLVVIFLKQVFSIRETNRLNRGLQQAHQSLSQAYTQLELAHTTIQKQALTDGLTGLPNHRAVMDQLGKELGRAQRYERPVSLLFFDADRFKKVNDTYGHAAGDAVLRHISQLAGSVLRSEDTLARFGGEEFVIVLPEADANEAQHVAERLRTVIAASPVVLAEQQGEIAVTVSIGVSTYPLDASQQQELLAQADAAMYVAKRMGRNQVRTAQEARQIGQDLELMALLQETGQSELMQREGVSPQQLRETYTSRTIYSLLSLLEHRNQGQSAHAHATSDWATAIARQMGVDAASVLRIGMAALLHDIGQVGLPDTLLLKASALTPQEHALLDEHAHFGAQVLESNPFLADLAPAIRHHHEHWNGKGSPDHLSREQIPLGARIIAVAEAYDFMQREHPYQVGSSAAVALAELKRCAGIQFDPLVVQALSEVLSDQHEQPARFPAESSTNGYPLASPF